MRYTNYHAQLNDNAIPISISETAVGSDISPQRWDAVYSSFLSISFYSHRRHHRHLEISECVRSVWVQTVGRALFTVRMQ